MKILLAIVAGMLAGGLLTMAHGASGVVIGAALGLVLALIARRLREQADRLADQDAKLHYLYQQFSAIQAEQASRKQAQAAGTDAAAAPSQPAPEPGLAGAPEAAAPARASAAQTAAGYAPAGAALDSTIAAQVEPAAPAPPPLRRPAEPAAGLPEADFPPPAPDWVDRAQAWLFGGNTVARLGVVVLFFGLAFLLKYAYEHSAVPPEMRLLGASVLALGLLGMGWKLRLARPGYALSLQGAAVGALYLTIFAALRLYGLLPPGAAFALLVLIAALSALLAVLQNAMAFAMLGAAGGFLAPLLTSTGSGSHVQLFSYYLLLDLGILFIAWKRAWRPLNLLGFAATFGVASLWGARYYRPELYATMEIFLVAFFLIYFAIPLLFARLPRSGGANYVDGTLVFGTPIAAFALQTLLVRDFEYGLAWTAVGLGALYLAAATFLLQRTQAALRLLAEALFALGVCFATLVFPLAFDARVSSAAWALEGCGLVWLGLRQRRPLPRAAGLILQLLSGGAYLFSLGPGQFDHPPGQAVLNPQFMGAMLIALAGLLTSLLIERGRAALAKYETGAASALFGWGWLWWLGAGLHECVRFAGAQDFGAALIFVSASWLALSFVQRRLDWQAPQAVTLWLIVVMWFAGVLQFGFVSPAHPAAALGWLAWPLAFAVALVLLRRHEQQQAERAGLFHAALLWLFALLAARECGWQAGRLVPESSAWAAAAWVAVPVALLAALSAWGRRVAWPIAAHEEAYLDLACLPLAVLLPLWAMWANIRYDGAAAPLPYFPFANPLDIALLAALLAPMLWLTVRQGAALAAARAPLRALVAVAAFFVANGILLRSFHHWLPIPYEAAALFASSAVQAGMALLWTVLGCLLMFLATRHGARKLWLCGAALLAATVLKLLLVDLANSGTVARIVAFMGVGLVMLVIGYLAPVPPAQKPGAEPR